MVSFSIKIEAMSTGWYTRMKIYWVVLNAIKRPKTNNLFEKLISDQPGKLSTTVASKKSINYPEIAFNF